MFGVIGIDDDRITSEMVVANKKDVSAYCAYTVLVLKTKNTLEIYAHAIPDSETMAQYDEEYLRYKSTN